MGGCAAAPLHEHCHGIAYVPIPHPLAVVALIAQVLSKSPKSRSIKTTDMFSFNVKFSCPMKRIRIPMATLEASHDKRRVEEDRSIAIEAAIVRIMKARKVLQHQQLVTEVLSQLAFFKPNPKVRPLTHMSATRLPHSRPQGASRAPPRSTHLLIRNTHTAGREAAHRAPD